MSRRVTVIEVNPDFGSVWTGLGIDVETDEQVLFGGDARPMADIADAIAAGEDVETEIEEWSILAVVKPNTPTP